MFKSYPYAVNHAAKSLFPLNVQTLAVVIGLSRQFSTPAVRLAELAKLFVNVFKHIEATGHHIELRGEPTQPSEPITPEEMAAWCVEFDTFAQSPEGQQRVEEFIGALVAARRR